MHHRFTTPASVAFLSVSAALGGCSGQASPAAGARAPKATASREPTPSASVVAGVKPPPVLTPHGVDSSPPADPATSPPAASVPAVPPGGRTSPDGKICGGIAGFRCPEKQFCSYAPSSRCGAGDMSGTCQATPDLCTMEFAPVCGCDRKTYGKACEAARSGVSVAKAGACKR